MSWEAYLSQHFSTCLMVFEKDLCIYDGHSFTKLSEILFLGATYRENGIIFHQAFQSPICQEGDVNSYACIDYRGTLEHPATTCTLEEEEGTNCWGAAYCIVEGRKKKRQRWCIWSEENASMTRKLWLTFIKKVILKSPL
ncbi:hypothetical protein ACS0TY_034975 [Phlomoides rotata]